MTAPKQWCLTKSETLNSFEAWRDNLIYRLSLEGHFSDFLKPDAEWPLRRDDPMRGQKDTTETVTDITGEVRTNIVKAASTKLIHLNLFLAQIANWAPVVSRASITERSTILSQVWQTLRAHYGFQISGSQFLGLGEIRYKEDDSPEDLFQNIMAFVEDSLLKTHQNVQHHGQIPQIDEVLSPTTENFVVFTWLQKIHPGLPALVRQKYATELRHQTLASIKPEVSLAMTSLLEELTNMKEMQIMRIASRNQFSQENYNRRQRQFQPLSSRTNMKQKTKTCKICKLMGLPKFDHFISRCPNLDPQDKEYFRTRLLTLDDDTEEDPTEQQVSEQTGECEKSDNNQLDDRPTSQDTVTSTISATTSEPLILRVSRRPSPILVCEYHGTPIPVTLDCGAESNLIHSSTAIECKIPIRPTKHNAFQADGQTPLRVVGETSVWLQHAGHDLFLDALIVDNLDVRIIAGQPFLEINDVGIRPAKQQVCIKDSYVTRYQSTKSGTEPVISRTTIRSSETTTIWPGELFDLPIPGLPPRQDNLDVLFTPSTSTDNQLASTILRTNEGRIQVTNTSAYPVTVRKHEHIGSVLPTIELSKISSIHTEKSSTPTPNHSPSKSTMPQHKLIQVDPGNSLDRPAKTRFESINTKFHRVFDEKIIGYNGAAGNVQAVVNMGPSLPPQRRGKIPLYQRKRLQDLQTKFDELEEMGVFVKPEDVDVNIEYVNPSFLVSSPNKSDRLVTAFTDIGMHAKPQPSLISNSEKALQQIGSWKYIIQTDLRKAFYQIPLHKDSMKFCGVVTPFRGTRTYARAAMGMPGSEVALEELLSRVLGDLLATGKVCRVADDLFCGADDPDQLASIWQEVLRELDRCDLKLSATKTIICPKTTTVLGWIWSQGRLSASSHRIATLASCQAPKTAKQMKSFVGAYKILSRVIQHTSQLVAPLEASYTGKNPAEQIQWTDELHAQFTTSQNALRSPNTITIPRPSDKIWIVTDGSSANDGLGSTLYVLRNHKLSLGGFFSARLKSHQHTWLPCEIEALSIAATINHFAPFIIESEQRAHLLTDSKPCVQAYEKLRRGEFSASPRLTTFLATASRYQVTIAHVAGAANLVADFASRNAPACNNPSCQICTFVSEMETAAVHRTSIDDILSGRCKLPFTNRQAWKAVQKECPDVRRCYAHVKDGTKPNKKNTKIKDVKRYYGVANISKDELLVVKRDDPFCHSRDTIIVPRATVPGLLTALHLRFDHPSRHQLRQIFSRFFYALDLDRHIEITTESCHTCAALKRLPRAISEQTSEDPPSSVGTSFAADVFKLPRQPILILRETVTSFTVACRVENEQAETLRNGLLQLTSRLRSPDGPAATIRTDPAPGFVAISRKEPQIGPDIRLAIGNPKNPNKNPVAESSIAEMRAEIRRLFPDFASLRPDQIETACQRLNSRIRSSGLSAYEMFFHRDQFSNHSIPVDDMNLILEQHNTRQSNHLYSERSKAKSGVKPPHPLLSPGDLVYLYNDDHKLAARPRYLVTSTNGQQCVLRKFVSDQLRSKPYELPANQCYRVPQFQFETRSLQDSDHDDTDIETKSPIDTQSKANIISPLTGFKSPRAVERVDIISPEPPREITELLDNIDTGPTIELTDPVDNSVNNDLLEGETETISDNSETNHQSDTGTVEQAENGNESSSKPQTQRYPSRRRRPNVRLKDYVIYRLRTLNPSKK